MDNRRDFFAMIAAAAAAAGATPAAAKVTDDILSGDQAKTLDHPFGPQKIYYQGPPDQLEFFEGGNLRLKAGMEPHPPHSHPEEEIMLVTEGSGEFGLEGKTTKVGPGAMLYCAANHEHAVKASPSEDLLFYYFKWKKKDA